MGRCTTILECYLISCTFVYEIQYFCTLFVKQYTGVLDSLHWEKRFDWIKENNLFERLSMI